MGFFRSERMLNKIMRFPRDNAIEIMNELGKLHDAIEFEDLNKNDYEARRTYLPMIVRCDENERKIQKFYEIADLYEEQIVKVHDYDLLIKEVDNKIKESGLKPSNFFDFIETKIHEDEKKLKELIEFVEEINEDVEILTEKKYIIYKVTELLSNTHELYSLSDIEIGSNVKFIAGTIDSENEVRMKRLIFRSTRGHAVPTFFNFPDSEKYAKRIFIAFFQASEEGIIHDKLLKVCELFNASTYNIPLPNEIKNVLNELTKEIHEKHNLLIKGKESVREFIRQHQGNGNSISDYFVYQFYYRKEKQIFLNLNKCQIREHFIDGEVWIPEEKYQEITTILNKNFSNNNISDVHFTDAFDLGQKPPTYLKTNDFTWAFQEIVNLYGVPRYLEINPALFACITFPFLFGVMFGDIGHGLILFIFSSYLCLNYDRIMEKPDSLLKQALKARYILLLMGFFSTFCGSLYNDFLSIPIGLFGSCYENNFDIAILENDCVYPYGIDPKWYVSSNELTFMNSLKMKLSVILGIFHMTVGILFKGSNSIYFGEWVEFIFIFIPQFVFFLSIFGYMVFLIFIKWTIDWSHNTSLAPSLITQLLNIFLKFGSVENKPLYIGVEFQEKVHWYILLTAIICIPIMLIPKPFIQILKRFSNRSSHQNNLHYSELVENNPNSVPNASFAASRKSIVIENHDDGLGEIVIHSSIETLEFILGSLSSTASYLRLWALSLAHAQLAKVFFEKTLFGPIQEAEWTGFIKIFIFFFFFASFTFAILMGMDLLECFLHTIRLHWVEFQNKFYKADGKKFEPFSFENDLDLTA